MTAPGQKSELKTLMTNTLVVKPQGSLFRIAYKESGVPPAVLRGLYTSSKAAEKAIQEFLIAENRIQGNGK